MELELHQLRLHYERLRKRHPARERQLLRSLAETGQQLPIVVVGEAGSPPCQCEVRHLLGVNLEYR